MLKIPKSLLYKWANYDKKQEKIMGRPLKFDECEKDFIYKTAEGKLNISNKVSSKDIAKKFQMNLKKI